MTLFIPLILTCMNSCSVPTDYRMFTGPSKSSLEACQASIEQEGIPSIYNMADGNISFIMTDCYEYSIS